MQAVSQDEIFLVVYCLLRELAAADSPLSISVDSLLVEDVGLDSFKFVDLTVRLEQSLCLDEFPMQQWVDRQIEFGSPLSVGSLVQECFCLVGSRLSHEVTATSGAALRTADQNASLLHALETQGPRTAAGK